MIYVVLKEEAYKNICFLTVRFRTLGTPAIPRYFYRVCLSYVWSKSIKKSLNSLFLSRKSLILLLTQKWKKCGKVGPRYPVW